MSGCYVNASKVAADSANATNRAPPRTLRHPPGGGGVASTASVSTSLCSSTVTSSAAGGAAATSIEMRKTQQSSSRTSVQHRRHHQRHQQQQQRPRSVMSQRLSQVYDIAVHGRPAFLHRAAVTPALWLLCQTVLVVLFALCCAFLINRPVESPRNSQPWIRLEFMRVKGAHYIYKTEANKPFGELICSNSIGRLGSQHCEEMRHYFELRTTSKETAIVIKKGTVYRVNAAVTFRQASARVFPQVDVSVNINNETWISCQEGITGIYAHCSLFGMRHLPMGSVVTFSTSMPGRQIASHSGVTFFDIEMR